MTIKCIKCNYENPEESLICGRCSAPLKPTEEFSSTKTIETPVQGLTSGTTFATRYEVFEELGKGGMGRVYKALDTEINEEVAIKLLKPEIASDETTVERFRNELKFSRKIAHKNICKMYHLATEGMTPYITMEYVKGEDLNSLIKKKGKLEEREAIALAKQVCEGLAEAHELGVIHRDLKPRNIMIDEQGRAKIMDFGIARSTSMPGVTTTGMIIGTPDYISPEQAEGEAADQRSDIYSLGVILYEMVTGSVPFKGDTALSVALQHKSKIPTAPKQLNPDVSDNLNKLILNCMEKERERRYQTAEDLLTDLTNTEEGLPLGERKLPAKRKRIAKKKHALKWKRVLIYGGIPLLLVFIIAGAYFLYMNRAATIHTIAVLPFQNLTGEPEQEFFADGITNELIATIGNIGAFRRVISFWTMMRYKGTEKTLQDIAKELEVDAVVTGSLQKGGGSVSIRVELTKAFPDEQNLWDETYDRTLTDVLVMSSEIAQTIAREIRIKLTDQEETRFTGARQVNPDTYASYLKGMDHLNRQENEQAITAFREAVERDTTDAMAYAGLALGYIRIGHDLAPTPDIWASARAAADRALRLDPELAEGYAALADVKLYYENDWEGAERAFKRANELNPNLAENHYHYSWYLYLFDFKEEAIAEHRRSQELDPLMPIWTVHLGLLHCYYGEYDEALTEINKVMEVMPNFPIGLFDLGSVYSAMGRFDEAIAAHKRLYEVAAGDARWEIKWPLGTTYALAGMREEAMAIVVEIEAQELDPWNAFGLASIYAALGDKDKTFEWLNFEQPHAWTPWVRVFPLFEFLRDDPRFSDLMNRLNLPPAE